MWKERKYSSGFGLLQAQPPQLQVTEAYYRMCASAAGEEEGRWAGPGLWAQCPLAGQGRPASCGVRWLGRPKTLSRNSDGQKTPAEPRGGEEGRGRGAERDLGRTVLKTLLSLLRSCSRTLLAPGRGRKLSEEAPGVAGLWT